MSIVDSGSEALYDTCGCAKRYVNMPRKSTNATRENKKKCVTCEKKFGMFVRTHTCRKCYHHFCHGDCGYIVFNENEAAEGFPDERQPLCKMCWFNYREISKNDFINFLSMFTERFEQIGKEKIPKNDGTSVTMETILFQFARNLDDSLRQTLFQGLCDLYRSDKLFTSVDIMQLLQKMAK